MKETWNQIQNVFSALNITVANIPLSKIIIVSVILLMVLALRAFFIKRIINAIESLTAKTETTLDDELIAAIKKPLALLVILAGIWISQLILADNLSAQLNETLQKLISLSFVIIVGYIIYRSAKILGYLLGLLTAKTDTELDDLIVPYIPLFVEITVGTVVVIKVSEVLLGASAGALLGLLGGAGVALGLLFKDIIYDWCCTVIIYVDDLYRPGQWVIVEGIEGFAKIVHIGIRSTELWSWEWASIKKLPNSKMISGVVENWDQNRGDTLEWGMVGTLKIDFLSADKSSRIVDGIQEILSSMNVIEPAVMFKGLEGNARVFKYLGYIPPNVYFSTAKNINLEILRLLEREGIDRLQVYLVIDPKTQKEMIAQVNNMSSLGFN